MSEEREPFLARWSRLKREAPESSGPPPASAPESQAPQTAEARTTPVASLPALPDIEALTPESDFRPFMDPRVDPSLRGAALKRLFGDAHFNIPDPFEAYSEDYTKAETIPLEMLKTLNQARKLLFDEAQPAPQAEAQSPESPPPEQADVAGRQDA
jgi:hypothetical protein